MRRIYFDHAATTPVRPEVREAMEPYLTTTFGNPSSIHWFGREARRGIEQAREQVANLIGSRPEEIIFTSGGTEADNMAIIGVALANEKKGHHIITSTIEHHAVLDSCQYLEKRGYQVTYLPVGEDGLVRVKDLEAALTPETVLITVMHANNEVGTVQPIAEIGRIARERGIFFHTDAVQTVGKIPFTVEELKVDMLSLSGHKIYGPKGIGALYIRKGTKMQKLLHGGGQERRRRPGTENVSGIVGLGKAAELAAVEVLNEGERLRLLRDRLISGLQSQISYVKLNGHPTKRLPHNVNICIEFIEGESILLSLDMRGIAASSGSACTSGSLEPSHVLLAMGIPHEVAHGSLRVTLGRDNTNEDIDYLLETLPEIVERLRSMSPVFNAANPSWKECSSCTARK